jgi:hypothetical protein
LTDTGDGGIDRRISLIVNRTNAGDDDTQVVCGMYLLGFILCPLLAHCVFADLQTKIGLKSPISQADFLFITISGRSATELSRVGINS